MDHVIGRRARRLVLSCGALDGDEQPLLVLKMAKRDAERLGRLIAGRDAISLAEISSGRRRSPVGPGPGGSACPRTLQGVDWAGPPETWPKASAVLLALAEPLQPGHAPDEALEGMAMILAAVWTAVVMADAKGDSRCLKDIRRRVKGEPNRAAMVEMLVRRKRQLFPRDTRIMMVDRITRTRDRVDLRVSWSPA